eukprot:7320-Heterococcus_DN1.PRE.1
MHRSMHDSKRQPASSSSPLDDTSLLFQILNYVGPGQHLFVSPVCKLWHECSATVPDLEITSLVADPLVDPARKLWCTPQTTLYSAIFGSGARVRLASQHLAFTSGNWRLQRIAGRVADITTLQVAIGLNLTGPEMMRGAAYSGSAAKLKFLEAIWKITDSLELPADLCVYAVSSGSLQTVQWVEKWGLLRQYVSFSQAATLGHVHVLDYIFSKHCHLHEDLLPEAARNGRFGAVKWLFEHDAPFYADTICGDAAESGNLQLVQFVRSKGGEINASTFRDAAWRGHLALCKHLYSEQCPWNTLAVAWAGSEGHTEVVKWLVQQGCPYDAADVCREAAESGHIAVLQYMLRPQPLSAVQLTDVLSAAAAHSHLHAAQWLRQQGAEWPVTLQYDGDQWSSEA